MFNSDTGRKLAAIVCTVLFSATCVAGAVGPAAASHPVATTQQSA